MSWMRFRSVLLGLAFLVGWMQPASGDTVEIRYTITSGAATTAEGNFPITSGSYSVTYQAAISGTVAIDGPAVLNTFSVNAAGFTLSGYFSETFSLALAAPLNGAGRAGSQFANTLDPLQLLGNVTAHCFAGPYCLKYGFVNSVTQQFPSFSFSAGAGSLSISGAQGLASGVYTIPLFTAGTATIFVTGQEIQRILHPSDRVTITGGPSADPNPVAGGEVAVASVMATDTFAHELDFQWSAVCPGLASDGVFATPLAASTDWTAPANPTGVSQDCTISVLVTDMGFGNNDGGEFIQTVPEPDSFVLGLAALAALVGVRRNVVR